ncbi:Denticleless protein [Galdieria sulphuraria]|nr:Denticleless protein [Galdieria sulphuraria]
MRTSSTLRTLFSRELERLSRIEYSTLFRMKSYEVLKTFWTSRRYSCEFLNDDNLPVPLFAVEFSKTVGGGQIIATCDEDGYVTLIDTSKSSSFGTHDNGWCSADFRENIAENRQKLGNTQNKFCTSDRPIVSFRVHENAIFSLCWLGLQDQWIATGSGDQKVKIFDINKNVIMNTLIGHSGSIKSIKERHMTDGKVLASASRDGNVMLWDTRCQGLHSQETGDSVLRPVLILKDIHRRDMNIPDKREYAPKRPRYSIRHRKNSMKPNIPHGVTSLEFAPFNDSFYLYTSGAVDGAIKLWDLRRASLKQVTAEPLSTIYPGCQEGLTDRPHGISSLHITEDGSNLCVSSTDSNIYLYKTGLLDRGSFMHLCGHTSSSFYIKACFSPDGHFVLSGSADSFAYVWDIKQSSSKSIKANLPLLRLPAHINEVTDVAWCKTDTTKLATVGDDSQMKLWQTRKQQAGNESVYETQYAQAESTPIEKEHSMPFKINRQVNRQSPTILCCVTLNDQFAKRGKFVNQTS